MSEAQRTAGPVPVPTAGPSAKPPLQHDIAPSVAKGGSLNPKLKLDPNIFIPLNNFGVDNLQNLPDFYDKVEVNNYVHTRARLAVRIQMGFISSHRPKTWQRIDKTTPYPFCEKKGQDINHSASGFVTDVEDAGQDYKCVECSHPPVQRKKHWAVMVCTARHVIYDTSEAQKSKVMLFNETPIPDDDEWPANNRKLTTLTGNNVEGGTDSETGYFLDPEKDTCYMICYTHDEKLATQLTELLRDVTMAGNSVVMGACKALYNDYLDLESNQTEETRLERQNRFKDIVEEVLKDYHNSEEDIITLINLLKRSPREALQVRTKVATLQIQRMNIVNELTQFYKRHTYDTARMKAMSQDWQQLGFDIIPIYSDLCESVLNLRDPIDESIQNRMNTLFALLKRVIKVQKHCLRKLCQADVPVIMVSHPHGAMKHVTVGTLKAVDDKFWKYDVPSCPGCSGALVMPLLSGHSGLLALFSLIEAPHGGTTIEAPQGYQGIEEREKPNVVGFADGDTSVL